MPSHPTQQRIWRTYLALNVMFAFANGMYGSYAFLYLKKSFRHSGGIEGSILDNLLFILALSMFFEFFAEPLTGDLADAYGRRRVTVGAFFALFTAMLLYWLISLGTPIWWQTVVLALLAELAFATSAAMFNGALDAWLVDELAITGGPTGAALQPLFSRQRWWFGLSMVAGGMLSLLVASAATDDHIAALPWLGAAAISVVAGTLSLSLLPEHRAPSRDEPTHQRIWHRTQRLIRSRPLRNAVIVSSVLYTAWICFMYLLPVLLTENSIIVRSGFLARILKDYYWYYLILGVARFIGPYFSNRIRLGTIPEVQFRSWAIINCGALALAGLLLLLKPSATSIAVPIALVLFWITKVCEEAFKPVRSTYINYLVGDGSDRAFVLSMTTPFGALLVLCGAFILRALHQFSNPLRQIQFSIPLLFLVIGAGGMLSILIVLRTKARRN